MLAVLRDSPYLRLLVAPEERIYERGLRTFLAGDARGAAELFEEVLVASPVHAFAYRDVGRARLAAGDVAAAADAFEAALRFDPEDEQARLGLDAARCRDLVERGALDEARDPCARAASAGLVPELALEHLASQHR